MTIVRQALIAMLLGVAVMYNLHADWEIVRMSDQQGVGFSQMMNESEGSSVIIVGESHDNKLHHALQLDVIRDLAEKKKPLAIGLEMFQTESQGELDDWVTGKISEEEFRKVYDRNWSMDWSLYRDIFIFAREKKVPLIALNIPARIVSKVAREGFDSLDSSDRKDLPPNVSCELNTNYTDFLRRTYHGVASHAMGKNSFLHFCEAQSLRNNGMAYNIYRYLQKHPAEKIVILTGLLHAVKTGLPDHLSDYGMMRYKVILPELPLFEPEDALLKETDYLVQ